MMGTLLRIGFESIGIGCRDIFKGVVSMVDVIIIGGGPAGFTSALYTARAKLEILLIERAYFGGQMATTSEMENYPGIETISGGEMADRMVQQATKFGAKVAKEEVLEVQLDGPVKKIRTQENTYEARTVILSMGASPRELGLENEKKLRGSGVSYCATCDGAFFKGKDVAVIGGGDTAAEDVLYLSRFCRKVYLIHRKDTLRAARVLSDLIQSSSKVETVWNSVIEEILGEFSVAGIKIKNVKTGETSQLNVNGLFIAIGNVPNTSLVEGKIELTQDGYIKTDDSMRTNIEGVFAAGDIRQKHLRQVVTAASDGAAAAHSAEKYINESNL